MRWADALSGVLLVCAVITTGLVVRREILIPATGKPGWVVTQPKFVANWQLYRDLGPRLGSADAPVQLLEFADFECPFCATFSATLSTIRNRYPQRISLSFLHYPLPGHRFAEQAARVAECADEQGRFEQMQNLLFEQQRVFGIKPWTELAASAGVSNMLAFESCIRSGRSRQRIMSSLKLAEQLDIKATPTLLVNGWRLPSPPDADELDRLVTKILAGKEPFERQE